MRTIVLTASSILTILFSTLNPAPVLGQEEAGVLEEITVTAARREQSMQDLAASITAFTSEELNELRVLQPQDLAEQTPGLLT